MANIATAEDEAIRLVRKGQWEGKEKGEPVGASPRMNPAELRLGDFAKHCASL